MYDFEAKPDAMNSVTPVPALKAPTPRKNHFSAGFAWISDNSLLQITNKQDNNNIGLISILSNKNIKFHFFLQTPPGEAGMSTFSNYASHSIQQSSQISQYDQYD